MVMDVKATREMAQEISAQAAKQADDENRKTRNDSKLIDVAYEAMREKAAADRDTLDALIRMGWPYVQRENFKGKVRKKVWEQVGETFETVDDDMVEEITERIVDAAESDPFYKRLFEGKE